MEKQYDIAILGGGPGGYVAAIRAAQLGFRTVVIDKDNLGGICLNWGCIPTKALLKNAEIYDSVKNHGEEFGISAKELSFDFEKIIQRSRGISDKITKNVEMLIKKNKIDRVREYGKFISKNQLEIFNEDGKKTETNEDGKKTETIKAGKIIIATGASPKSVPAIPVDRKNIITSTEAMILPELPKELIVIGAGAIGIEFAYFYSVLGTKVTVIEMLDNILPIEDADVSKELTRNFRKRKMEILTSTMVEKAVVKGSKVEVTVSKKGETKKFTADKVLNAIGVTGNVTGFGLEVLGIELYKDHIKVDKETYETNIPGIFAIGDVIGPPWLAHVASAEGIHCVERIKGINNPKIEYNNIPGLHILPAASCQRWLH